MEEFAARLVDALISVRAEEIPLRLQQILINLIGNGLKFTTQGEVALSVRQLAVTEGGLRLRFDVRDTGIGIQQDQLPRLFDRFWQAQGRRDGAGLGLYIASGIVDAHGSALTVESIHGSGSTFTFALPLAVP